jgi:hypothetical protein
MKKLTDREIMLLLNGVALTADILHNREDDIPNSSYFESMEHAKDYINDIYAAQPYITYKELDDLFTKLTDIAYGARLSPEQEALLNLPPSSEYIH